MKILTILLPLLLVCCSSISQPSESSASASNLYEVVSIKNKRGFYLVILKKGDSLYKLCNDKTYRTKHKRGCSKIKEGGLYSFDLEIIYPWDTLFGISVMPNLGVVGDYRGYPLSQDEKYHYKTYTAANMNGLCLKNSETFIRKELD